MFKRIRDRLVDRLATLVWEGVCRLALPPDWSSTLRDMGEQLDGLQGLEPQLDALRRRVQRLEPQAVTIQLDVGKSEGATSDLQRVEFQGERVAQFQGGMDGFQVQKALYRTVDGELLVHVKMLEKSAGFPTTYSLYTVEEADLAEGGLHEELGRARGTLSLSEALGEA